MYKMYESTKITAISEAQKDGALGQGENVCAMILWHQFLATSPCVSIPSLGRASLWREGAAVHYIEAWLAQRKPISTDKTKTESGINS